MGSKLASFLRARAWAWRRAGLEITGRIASEVGRDRLPRFQVHAKDVPHYRFVDVYRAIERFCQVRGPFAKVNTEHGEDLNSILHGRPPGWVSRRIKRAANVVWPTGAGQEVYLPVDGFWLSKDRSSEGFIHLILRVRYDQFHEKTLLEVAAEDGALAEATVAAILEHSIANSIYRSQVLELVYESAVKDEYGDVERPDRLRVLFKRFQLVEDDDIVMDEDVRRMLWRNVIDLHTRREVLKAHRVPVRRGVLLYGPPGTGKTFACRYLCGKLPNTTRIMVTGTALRQVSSIFGLARMLQPSLLILEDVDLVFASREIAGHGSVLGDLLDQMDGLRPHEDIGFVLTTNSMERMEAAIRDRPGRISQCIGFGPPGPELRRRYLLHYLRHYAAPRLNVAELVSSSNGATQAFLKEWVHRSVQIATERLDAHQTELELLNEDFRQAMEEMKRFSEGATGRIIGFHGG